MQEVVDRNDDRERGVVLDRPWIVHACPRTLHRRCAMSALLVGYARCSSDQHDLTAQRDGLLSLGVQTERI